MAQSFSVFLDYFNMPEDDSVVITTPPRKKKVYKIRKNPMRMYTDEEFKKKYRFTKRNMTKIIELVREDLDGSRKGGRIPVDLQVMAAIRYWGRNEVQDDGADMHGFSQPTLSILSARVAKAFASKSSRFIKMPQTTSEQIESIEEFRKLLNFPHVIGAIDCTHIRIQRQGGESGQYYVNRKGYFSINTQVVCDAHLKIREIVAHWRGSTHDSRIYRESTIKERLERGDFRGRLLGDGGYACNNHLFTPVLNPRNTAEENYNIAHIATRNAVERTFGVWKSRFRILLTGMRGTLKSVKTTIVALAVLHNLAIEYNDQIDENDVGEENLNTPPAPAEQLNRYQDQENSRRAFILNHFS